MLRLALEKDGRAAFRILCLGAHSDDIEIGCGGTILTLLADHRNLEFHWVVFSSGPEREVEARCSANLFLKGAAGKKISILDFRNSFFPFQGLMRIRGMEANSPGRFAEAFYARKLVLGS